MHFGAPVLELLEDRCHPSVSLGTNFVGLDFNAGGAEPPDTDVAAGPAYIVETVNTTVAYYSKSSGANLFQQDLSNFFAPAGAGPATDLFDPVVTYDELAGRFVVSVQEENDAAKTSFIDVGVSNSSDPTQGFTEMHRISLKETNASASPLWADYPRMGWNADAIVYSFNMYAFPSATGAFDHVQLLSIATSSVVDANNSTFSYFRTDRTGPNDGTLVPATMHGAAAGGPEWLLEENDGSSNLRFVQMTSELSSSPSFNDFVVSVPSYSAIVPPTQPNGRQITTVIDTTIQNVSIRGTELVADQNVGHNGVTHARWYQFDLSGSTPSLVQWGGIDQGTGVFTYYPAIDIAPNGNLGMSFMESSSKEFMSIYVTGRITADLSGTMETPVLVQAGQANYNGNRAGDFSGIGIDPNDGSFWAANEYANQESTNWGTWIANFIPNLTPPTVTSLTVTPNPGGEAGPVALSGSFTDPTAGQTHTITVNWGDSSANDTASIAAGSSNFGPINHTYEETPVGVPFTITVTVGNSSGSSGKGTTTVSVNDAPLTASGASVIASPNQASTVVVATFTDADPAGTIGDYGATITWGDGHTSSGTIAANGSGGFMVTGTNTYAAAGTYTVTVQIMDHGASATATDTAIVTGPATFVTGADAGGAPLVEVFDGATGLMKSSFNAYDPSFRGGVRVATGDVNDDGIPDIITGPGPGGGPEVKVFDGKTGQVIRDFMAFDPNFLGGVFVAAGDVNGDGASDIIVGADAGGGPEVIVFSGKDGSVLRGFFAYDPHFMGGVRVAAGDVNGDGKADIITAAGPGGGPQVIVFSGADGSVLRSFFAYDPNFGGGVHVAAGDINGDGKADILTGAGPGGGPQVTVFSGADGTVLQSYFAYDPRFSGGVRVAAMRDSDGDNPTQGEIVTAPGSGGGPHVQVRDGATLNELISFFAYDPTFTGGVFVDGF
jgi:hypothetical protein